MGSSVDGAVGPDEETVEVSREGAGAGDDDKDGIQPADVIRIAREEREAAPSPGLNGKTFHGYGKIERDDDSIMEGSEASLPQATNDTESVEGSVSIPDDTPSLPVTALTIFISVADSRRVRHYRHPASGLVL